MDQPVLVGILPTRRDLQILESDLWYRVPCDSAVTRDQGWPPKWFAAFETVPASGASQQIRRYAEVREIQIKSREELFPGSPAGHRAGKLYYQILLHPLQYLESPLRPLRPRRNPFIRTTLENLTSALEFNDIFHDSPFEDDLWQALKSQKIDAERQWNVVSGTKRFVLDFALFCRERAIDLEVDGRSHHSVEQNSISDAERDRLVAMKGWAVIRFRTTEIANHLNRCLVDISKAISMNGGMMGASVVRNDGKTGMASQLALLEERFTYDEEWSDD